jgi:SAM-dependent methyltransferase
MEKAIPGYAFGDTDLAARRLAMVGAIFDPPSRAFITRSVTSAPELALDLGCGPGNTTRLLADSTHAARTVGLDQSVAFVETARRAYPELEFAVTDVASTPFPTGPADVVYARLVLAHLADPIAALRRWEAQVRPGGILLLDEVAFIHTDDPALGWYESVVVGLVSSRGADMYAGARLPEVIDDVTIVELPVDAVAAATMYSLNLQVWRDDPWVLEHVGVGAVDELATALTTVTSDAAVTWGLAQARIATPPAT